MIFFLIPVFNEEKNIPNLHRELAALKLNQPVYYVFSDDGSTDQSVVLITDLFKSAAFTIIGDGINRGPGAAFNAGFEWILQVSKSPDDSVVTLEADCTSDLSLLPIMLMLRNAKYDLVLASVYAQGGGFEKTSFARKFISASANFMFRFLFDVQVLTLSSFYRVYSISILSKVKAANKTNKIISETGFICMLEVLLKSIQQGASVIEVPMTLHSSKRQGESKMKILKTMLQYFSFLFKNKINHAIKN
jgi:dolichol-phosphate mannosyltransferase